MLIRQFLGSHRNNTRAKMKACESTPADTTAGPSTAAPGPDLENDNPDGDESDVVVSNIDDDWVLTLNPSLYLYYVLEYGIKRVYCPRISALRSSENNICTRSEQGHEPSQLSPFEINAYGVLLSVTYTLPLDADKASFLTSLGPLTTSARVH